MAKTYTAAGTVVAGEVYTAAAHNIIATDVNNLIVPPGARAVRTTNLSYTSNTAIAWESISAGGGAYDTDGMWSVANASRLTINTAGVYVVTFNYYIAFTGTVTTYEAIIDSSALGSFIAHDVRQGSFTGQVIGSITFTGAFAVADYVSARVALTGGSAYVFTGASATQRSGLSAAWVGRTS